MIGGETDSADALGAYFFDAATGAISEARILFTDLSEAAPGASIAVEVPEGQTLGLFLVRGVDEIGVDLEQFTDGGLHLTNLLTGAPASMTDLFAPTVMDDAGNILPIQPLSAFGADDGTNLLNPAGSLQAIGLSSKAPGAGGIEIIGFEDRLNTSPDYDGDFNDAIVAVSEAPIAAATLRHLRLEAQGAGPGTPDDDRQGRGGEDDHCSPTDGARTGSKAGTEPTPSGFPPRRSAPTGSRISTPARAISSRSRISGQASVAPRSTRTMMTASGRATPERDRRRGRGERACGRSRRSAPTAHFFVA